VIDGNSMLNSSDGGRAAGFLDGSGSGGGGSDGIAGLVWNRGNSV